MGKHRSAGQEKIFIDFMERHQDLARGYVKGDRVVVESYWSELAKELNLCGPPTKDVNGWKKAWADWKTYVKKKMCHNKKENQKTGGGEYNKYVLSDVEESVARISGIYKSVDGISGSKSFSEFDVNLFLYDSEKENETIDVRPSTSAKRQKSCSPSPEPKRPNLSRSCTPCPGPESSQVLYTASPFVLKRNSSRTPPKPDVNSLLVEENQHLKNLVQLMSDKLNEEKKITKLMEEQRDQMVIQNQMFGRLCNILEKHFEAKQKNDTEVKKVLCEKNEFKLKLIELETLKLEIERKKAERF